MDCLFFFRRPKKEVEQSASNWADDLQTEPWAHDEMEIQLDLEFVQTNQLILTMIRLSSFFLMPHACSRQNSQKHCQWSPSAGDTFGSLTCQVWECETTCERAWSYALVEFSNLNLTRSDQQTYQKIRTISTRNSELQPAGAGGVAYTTSSSTNHSHAIICKTEKKKHFLTLYFVHIQQVQILYSHLATDVKRDNTRGILILYLNREIRQQPIVDLMQRNQTTKGGQFKFKIPWWLPEIPLLQFIFF